MKIGPLIYLIRFLETKKGEIDKIKEKILTTEPADPFMGSFLALNLHHLYCALEDIFKEIGKVFENQIEDLSKYHLELLKRMTYDLSPLRPAVLSQESFDLLNELRKFRHFLRHAYSVELDLISLKRLKDMVREKFVVVERDLDNFRDYLEGELKKKLEEVA
uniref:HepT-like domain-containing protein n=1 Tax=Caldimicrobium thiodismutans TaxID=1653476 RepID=A0A832GKN4_9BACT